MLRSRANTIEGGTTEVNKNVIGERVPRPAPRARPVRRRRRGRTCRGRDRVRDAARRARGPVGWLVFDRPDAGNAMDATMLAELERAWQELDADPQVRVIVNTGDGRGVPDRPRRRASSPATRTRCASSRAAPSDAELKLTAWHNGVQKPVIAAVNGVCAGGGLHFVADADIVIAASNATFLDPHVSIGQVTRLRGDRAGAEVADGADRAHGARRPPRADHRRAGPPARHPQRGRRPARAAARRGPRPGRARSPATRPPPWPPPSGRCGARSSTGLTDACRAGSAELVGMWGHPDQEEGPRAFTEKREPQWQEI